jgi:hypothetical protein
VADYGVNIAVAVKNTQAITQLSGKIKETGLKVNQLNDFLENFADVTGTTVVNSVKNFNKALSDASKNLNNAALDTEAATKAAKDYIDAQDQLNASLREQKELLRFTRQTVSPTPFGPQPAKGFNAERAQFQTRARLLALETQKKAKAAQTVFNAERKFADQLFAIEVSLSKKARDIEINNIIKEYEIENRLQDTLFKKQIDASEERAKTFMAELGFKKGEELKAIKEVDRARKKAASEAIRLTGQTSPIGGAVGIPGSPAALAAAERAQRIKSAQGSALIGGAFPLLFGQGGGAAVGGALGGFGGGMIGGEFGFGLSLVGTQVGSLVDQLIQNATDLGNALNPLTASTETILRAVGKADTEFASLINELETAGQSALALQLATEELERVVGVDGVEALEVFSAGIKGLQNDFTIFVTKLSATVAAAINALTGETSLVREIRDRNAVLIEARKKTDDPEIAAAFAELDKLEGFGVDPKDRIAAQEKIVNLMKEGTKASRDSIELAAKEEKRLTTQVKANEAAREARYLVGAQIELAEVGNDLTNEAVVLAREKVIQERYLAEARGHSEGSQQALLAADNKALALKQLSNDILQAETAAKERQQRIQEKSNREAERERKKAERALERKQKAFERNEEALLRLQQRGAQQREQQEIKAVEAGGALIDRLSAERELRLAILAGTEERVRREQRIEELMQGQEDGMRGIVEQYVEFESAELKAIKRGEQLNNLYAGIGQTIETGVVDMITAATDKTKSLAEAASNTLRQLANQLLRFGINAALGGLGGNDGVGFFSRLFPQRALGGSVSSNRPYMVGERGPELFVPGAQGNVVPNNAMGGANVVVNVDASGSQAQGNQPNAKALGSAIGAAVQAELIKQKRPGGLLA